MTQNTTQHQQPATGGQVPEQHPLDEALEMLEDIVAGVLSAVGVIVWSGLSLAHQGWVNDRPRRRAKRTRRRLIWRYSKGWRRSLLYAELALVVGWLITRSVIRMPRSTWKVARPAAAQGWSTGVHQARAQRAARRGQPIPPAPGSAASAPDADPAPDPAAANPSGPAATSVPTPSEQRDPTAPGFRWNSDDCLDYVDEAVGGWCPRCLSDWQLITATFSNGTAAARMICPRCGAWRGAQDSEIPTGSPQPDDDGATAGSGARPVTEPQVTVTASDLPGSTPPPDTAKTGTEDVVDAVVLCTWLEEDGTFCNRELPDGEIFCLPPRHSQTPATAAAEPSHRWDGAPETNADRRFFDARESGYEGWLDQDGYPVPAAENGWPTDPAPPAPAPGVVDGYEPDDSDPANAAVPHPACSGRGCEYCGNGQVPAWSVDPAFGVVPATPQIPGATPAPVPATASAVATTERNDPAMSTTTFTSSSTGGSIATDLQHVQDLRLETDRASVVLEQFEALGKMIRIWTNSLPERVQAAPFGTKNINAAVNGIAEHGAKSGDLREQLTLLRKAIGQAEALGDHIGTVQAEGKTDSYAGQ